MMLLKKNLNIRNPQYFFRKQNIIAPMEMSGLKKETNCPPMMKEELNIVLKTTGHHSATYMMRKQL